MATTDTVTLDQLDNIVLDGAMCGRFHNELQVLVNWCNGLYFLYSQTSLMEKFASE